MKDLEFYSGREQTYVKHFFLEKYIERLCYNIFSFRDKIVYVDGFSGPWKNTNEDLADTSFYIASEQLKKIVSGFGSRSGSKKTAACLFIEKRADSFADLEVFCRQLNGINATPVHAEFEDAVDQVLKFVSKDISFVFIDPTGWTGFPLEKITPILQLRGETMINFMFDHVNRFLFDDRPENARSLDELFGAANWQDEYQAAVSQLEDREEAIIEVYTKRLRQAARKNGLPIPFVSSVKIKNPLKERTYFHLVYVTRSWKGIVEFRKVEKTTLFRQEEVRNLVRLRTRSEKSGQNDLFMESVDPAISSNPLIFEKSRKILLARERLENIFALGKRHSMKELYGEVLQIPMVWTEDLRAMLLEMRKAGNLKFLNGEREVFAPGENSMIEVIAQQ